MAVMKNYIMLASKRKNSECKRICCKMNNEQSFMRGKYVERRRAKCIIRN